MRRFVAGLFAGLVELLSSLALVVMFFVVMYGICARYMVSRPGFWIEELARYCMFFMTLIGGAAAMADDLHPSLAFVTDRLKGWARFAVGVWVELLLLLSLGLLLAAGWEMMMESTRMRTVGLRIRYSYVYAAIPLGCLLMLAAVVRRLAATIRKRPGASGESDLPAPPQYPAEAPGAPPGV